MPPLANWLAAQQQQQVTVLVANKPDELVQLAVQGKADLVVPNLVAYLQIQQLTKTMLNFLVPAGQASTNSDKSLHPTENIYMLKFVGILQAFSFAVQNPTNVAHQPPRDRHSSPRGCSQIYPHQFQWLQY